VPRRSQPARRPSALGDLDGGGVLDALTGVFPLMTSLARWACFITHDWGSDELGRDNHERAGRVAAALQEAGLAVWFDENE